jgi:hypothetical protein
VSADVRCRHCGDLIAPEDGHWATQDLNLEGPWYCGPSPGADKRHEPVIPVLVLVIPPCGVCTRAAAAWRAELAGATVDVCDRCRDALRAGEAAPLADAARAARRPNTAQVQRYLAAQPFKHARTVPEHPHEYLVLSASTDPWLHLRVIAYIEDRGHQEVWRPAPGRTGTTYTYWRGGDGWEYWPSPPAMSGPSWAAPKYARTILNRRRWTPRKPDDE